MSIPVRLEDEARKEQLERWVDECDGWWSALNEALRRLENAESCIDDMREDLRKWKRRMEEVLAVSVLDEWPETTVECIQELCRYALGEIWFPSKNTRLRRRVEDGEL